MATYAYKCSGCGNVFDIEATIQEKEEGKSEKFSCPRCQSKNIKQEFSAGNFIKNIFKNGNKTEGCCSNGAVCGASRKPNEKENNNYEDKNSHGGCCG